MVTRVTEGNTGFPPLQSLERGLAVLQAFTEDQPAMSLSDVAKRSGITRATARRILLTLEDLGHVRSDGRLFSLTPRVLAIGGAYLSALDIAEVAQEPMAELTRSSGESCSIGVLDLPDVVYVFRVPTQRIMATNLGIGTRLPAHATSMGKVLLAALSEPELDSYLAADPLERIVPGTITDPVALRAGLDEARTAGWALADQELELGLRSVAAPIHAGDGRAVAAVDLSVAATRVSVEELHDRFVGEVVETAAVISAALAARGAEKA
jgi:IclR family pca regulon transcriptional regulator